MHLALFLHALSTGGAQRRSIMLANGLAARGHRVDLITAIDGGPQAGLVDGAVMHLPLAEGNARDVASGGARTGDLMSAIRPLSRYLRRNRPDMLIGMANHAVLPSILAHGLARVHGTGLVLRASNHLSRRRGGQASIRRLPEAWLWRRADGVLAVSNDVARDVRHVTGLPTDRILSVTSPILPDRLPSLSPARQDNGPHHILCMGRFVRQKGFDTALRAFALLAARRDVHLTVAGDGPDAAALRDLAQKLGVADKVTFPGLIADPFSAMANADLFLLSSRWEGMPGVLVEAMAVGCPVVSTDCPGGSRELLRQGALGPLVAVDDAEALADAMDGALCHPASAKALRERASAFTMTKATESYERALIQLANNARGAGRSRDTGTGQLAWHLD